MGADSTTLEQYFSLIYTYPFDIKITKKHISRRDYMKSRINTSKPTLEVEYELIEFSETLISICNSLQIEEIMLLMIMVGNNPTLNYIIYLINLFDNHIQYLTYQT